jgi:hypothetical protein
VARLASLAAHLLSDGPASEMDFVARVAWHRYDNMQIAGIGQVVHFRVGRYVMEK